MITDFKECSVSLISTPFNLTKIDNVVSQILDETSHVKQHVMQLSKAVTKAVANCVILKHQTKALTEANQ